MEIAQGSNELKDIGHDWETMKDRTIGEDSSMKSPKKQHPHVSKTVARYLAFHSDLKIVLCGQWREKSTAVWSTEKPGLQTINRRPLRQ